jgi:gliding motility-associated-like protein
MTNSSSTRTYFNSTLCLLALLAPVVVQAQREMDHWIFGVNVHLDFSTSNPVQLPAVPLNAAEGSACISDQNGNLLFYTDGQTIWTSTHATMANGTGLLGHFSGSQNSLIIPVPGSTTQYYVFTNGHHNDNNGLRYSVVDMSLNGGAGAVTATKNVLLLAGPNTEKLTAVKHCNGQDFWVLSRGWNNTELLAWLVTSSGVSTTPVVSNSPFNLATLSATAGVGNVARIGYMKASPAGTRIAIFHAWSNVIELAEFNPWNGQFSNVQVLDALPAHLPKSPVPTGYIMPYSGDFSPNGRYLYALVNYYVPALSGGASSLLYQFDVSVMNTAAIEASRFRLDSIRSLEQVYNGAGAVQLANNGRVYVGYCWHNALSVINNPNNGGASCGYQYDPIPLANPTAFRAGFPNFFPFFAAEYPSSDFTFEGNCDSTNVKFSFGSPHTADSVVWNFGDPASGSANASRLDSPFHRFSGPGYYNVRLIVYKKAATVCHNPIDTVTKRIFVAHLDLGNDTTLCADSLRLPRNPLTFPGGTYLWSTGETTPSINATTSGSYWLHESLDGCTMRDTITIDLNGDPVVNLGNDTSICDRDLPWVLRANQPPGTQHVWSNGLSAPEISITRSGKYWLEISLNHCSGSDTIDIKVVPVPHVYIGPDTIICEAWPLRIGTVVADATYMWSTGATQPYIEVSQTGSYVLSVDLEGCVVSDTAEITAMPTPDIDLGGDRDICRDQTIMLDATYGTGSSYLWHTGDTTATYEATEPGEYSVEVTSEYGCIGSGSVVLSYYPDPTVHLGHDTTVCEETPLLLSAFQTNADSLVWSDGSIGSTLEIKYGGEYIVTGINKCGTDEDTILIKQIFCDIWMPNAFTPNGDGVNDVFRILGNIGRMQGVALSIFNRWGERIFFTEDKYKGWDGKVNGNEAMLGTYVYMLQYSLDGKPYLQKGNFHLIR